MSLYRKLDVTAMQLILVQNRHQTHDLTLIGSGANGLGILKCSSEQKKLISTFCKE